MKAEDATRPATVFLPQRFALPWAADLGPIWSHDLESERFPARGMYMEHLYLRHFASTS